MAKGRPKKDGSRTTDNYRKHGPVADTALMCMCCKKTFQIKSNKGIADELVRISAYLTPPVEPSCSNSACENAEMGVFSSPESYTVKGNRGASRRFRCKKCRRDFSVRLKSTAGQKQPHKNRTVFAEIVSKKPIRGISEVADLSANAVYGKIDFIYEQCRAFAGERERVAPRIKRKYVRLCVDRQDYMINWQSKKRRKNVQFSSTCTVEAGSGYVLGHHLNYDPDANQVDIDDAARINGDLTFASRKYFHAHPQYWKTEEFNKIAEITSENVRPSVEEEPLTVDDLIATKEADRRSWPSPHMADYPTGGNQLPPNGVMTHLDYTTYAHAKLVRRLIGQPKYTTIYLDQDEVLRSAYISAFSARIAFDEADMAIIQFQKKMSIDEKRDLSRLSRLRVLGLMAKFGCDEEPAISKSMALEYEKVSSEKPDWRNRWVAHPKDTINEPCRRIQYLTDTGRRKLEDIGWTLSGATLAPVDNYFMRIRRKLYYLERPIPSRTNANRLYFGYSAYDPRRVAQYLEIFRVYSNFIHKDSKGRTPAMKFGLAKGPLKFEDILYWTPFG